METTLYIQKWDGSYLLTITVTRPGYPGNSIEMVIDKSDYTELQKMGISDLDD